MNRALSRPSTDNLQTTISALNADFAGRRGSPDYDDSKLIHIHRRNRAFVWNREMQERCLDSILKGYYIPPIICCSDIRNNHECREVMEGGNRITVFRMILNGEIRALTPEERSIVERHPITLVVMRNLTHRQKKEMFRRLNKNVKVTDGQLFAMSEDDSPLIQEAVALLNADDYPLRDDITACFFDTRGKDNDGCTNLSNAVALVSGALHGPDFITKSFNVQEPMIESNVPVDRARVVTILGHVLEVFRAADRRHPLEDKRRRKGQWAVGKWLSVILYDILMNPDEIRLIQDKWATYLVKVRRGDAGSATLQSARIWGGNLTADRHYRISTMVDIYLRDNRVLTGEEVIVYRHPRPDGGEETGADEEDSIWSDETEDEA